MKFIKKQLNIRTNTDMFIYEHNNMLFKLTSNRVYRVVQTEHTYEVYSNKTGKLINLSTKIKCKNIPINQEKEDPFSLKERVLNYKPRKSSCLRKRLVSVNESENGKYKILEFANEKI